MWIWGLGQTLDKQPEAGSCCHVASIFFSPPCTTHNYLLRFSHCYCKFLSYVEGGESRFGKLANTYVTNSDLLSSPQIEKGWFTFHMGQSGV